MLARFILSSVLSGLSTAAYTLTDDYLADGNFLGKFNFFTDSDPTHGFVKYVSQSTAQSSGYVSQSKSNVYMGVDYKNVAPNGRNSVRITSTKTYNSGLFILDLQHMPGGICGTWPAFWLVGDNWPSRGEIDIIEGVNDGNTNAMTLHTSSGCSIKDATMTGHINTYNCDVNAANQPANAGCSIGTSNTQTYGSAFNSAGGGVFATNFQQQGISVWFFPRNSIPSDIKNGQPNPSNWGTPIAYFTGCDTDRYINNQHIVFDTTFCGDWAGNVWGQSSSCSTKASSCTDYVKNNPSAFQNAYWSINSLKVYQLTSNAKIMAEPANTTTLQTSYTNDSARAKTTYSMTMA